MSPATATLPEEKPSQATASEAKPAAAPTATETNEALESTIIEAQHPWWPLVDFAELWRHREMLYSLTMREIMRRYKQTVLGAVWAVFPTIANTVLVALVFLPLLRDVKGLHTPVALFIFCGLLPWYLFSNIMHSTAHSVTDHSDLISRIYFPRLILPLSCIADRLLDFVIGLGILLLALLYFMVWPSPNPEHHPIRIGPAIVFVPLIMLGLVAAGLGVGLITAAAGVAYRDVFHALSLFTQFWFFATPAIFYPKSVLPTWVHPWLPLNPAFGLIENFRIVMVGEPGGADYASLFISLGVSFVLLLIGVTYFQGAQRNFSDVI